MSSYVIVLPTTGVLQPPPEIYQETLQSTLACVLQAGPPRPCVGAAFDPVEDLVGDETHDEMLERLVVILPPHTRLDIVYITAVKVGLRHEI